MKLSINVKTVGVFLIAVLLFLIFLSKSIYHYSLPTVTAVLPINGRLHKIETAKGVAGWEASNELNARTAGYIREILIGEGERAKKGQPLIRLEFTDEAVSSVREKEYELQQVDIDIHGAEEDRNRLRTLYEAGALPKNDYEREERNLQALYAKQQKIQRELQDAVRTESLIIYAPEDCIVTELAVHAGQRVAAGERVGYYCIPQSISIECRVPLEIDFIAENDLCRVENSSYRFEGKIISVSAEGDEKKIRIQVSQDDQNKINIKESDTFDVIFEKESAETRILISSGAVNRDSEGYYLYQIKQREGLLGREYSISKLRVHIGDNDNEYTVITEGITFFEPVILSSDRELADGDTVIMANEGDFFELK